VAVTRRAVLGAAVVLALALTAGRFAGGAARAESGDIRSFALDIRDGRVAPDKRTIRVREGDRVELRWTADTPVELHLHGYDVTLTVSPGAAGTMTLRAHAAGRFPIAIHGVGSHHRGAVAYLEVHPR